MRMILNFLWFILGGFVMGVGWWLAALLMAISIIGIPWARACFIFGKFCFFPFGREAIDREALTSRPDIGTGTIGFLGNVIWFLFCGLWLCLAHLSAALACAVTIIGIPFAIQHFKLALCALAPIGKTIVTKEEAAAARREKASTLGS
jgi:uncharacterized membrane protein YccF (DUF307 family)